MIFLEISCFRQIFFDFGIFVGLRRVFEFNGGASIVGKVGAGTRVSGIIAKRYP